MDILVTGCSGFIGSHFCEKLLNNDLNVLGIDNFDPFYDPLIKEKNLRKLKSYKNFKFVKADIRDLGELKTIFNSNNIEKVVHFAAKAGVRTSIEQPFEYVTTNILGTINLLESCRNFDIDSFDFAGSSSVYGNDSIVPFVENILSDKPESPYAATKRSCELFGYTYHSLYAIRFNSYRFFSVYGPRGRPDMAVYKFTENIIQDKEVTIYGDGTYQRDFTYVSDIVDGMFLGLNKKLDFEIFNLGNENPISVIELVNLLEGLIGKQARIKYQEAHKADSKITFADISKARNILAFKPKIDIKQGLQLFIEWYKNKDDNNYLSY